MLLLSVPRPVALADARADVRGANALLGSYTDFGNLVNPVALAAPMSGIWEGWGAQGGGCWGAPGGHQGRVRLA